MHNWGDSYARQILKQLRISAEPSTKLVIMDQIVPYACSSGDTFADIPGAEVPLPPSPLLANLGVAKIQTPFMDLNVRELSASVSEHRLNY